MLIALGNLTEAPVAVALCDFAVAAALTVRRVRGAILADILVSAGGAWALGLSSFQGIVSLPPSIAPTVLQLDIVSALRSEMAAVVFIFFS